MLSSAAQFSTFTIIFSKIHVAQGITRSGPNREIAGSNPVMDKDCFCRAFWWRRSCFYSSSNPANSHWNSWRITFAFSDLKIPESAAFISTILLTLWEQFLNNSVVICFSNYIHSWWKGEQNSEQKSSWPPIKKKITLQCNFRNQNSVLNSNHIASRTLGANDFS